MSCLPPRRLELLVFFEKRPCRSVGPAKLWLDAFWLSAGKREVHSDLRVNFNWLTIQNVWLVAPLLHCVERRLRKQRVSADHVQILNGSVLADNGSQLHCALHPGGTRQRRITRLYLVNDQASGNSL